jgi:hypothetical protein
MVKAAGLLAGIEKADSARITFGEVRYWMTDLAVSQLTLSERNAAAARARMEDYLRKLAPWNPQRIAEFTARLRSTTNLPPRRSTNTPMIGG